MKTSNKLLAGFAIFSFLVIATLMLVAKSKMMSKDEYRKQLKLTGKSMDRILLDNLTTDDIEMGDNFDWILDPNGTEVIVTGDEAVVSKLEVSDNGQFRIRTGLVGNIDFGLITVMVGIKNLDKLRIDGGGNAKISTLNSFAMKDLKLRIGGNAKCVLEVDSPEMKASSHGNGKITLIGSTEKINGDVSGNGKLYTEKLSVKKVNISASGNGKYYGGKVVDISGNASGNAKIEIQSPAERSNVSTSGNGRFTINR